MPELDGFHQRIPSARLGLVDKNPPNPQECYGNDTVSPNAFRVVSSWFDPRVDVVSSLGNDFFLGHSLSSLNQLPRQQKID